MSSLDLDCPLRRFVHGIEESKPAMRLVPIRRQKGYQMFSAAPMQQGSIFFIGAVEGSRDMTCLVIEDFDRVQKTASSSQDLFDRMTELYPHWVADQSWLMFGFPRG
jgi:hypothetical protein